MKFKNVYLLDEEIILEYVKNDLQKRHRILALVLTVFFAFTVIISVFSSSTLLGIVSLIGLVLGIVMYFFYFFLARQYTAAIKRQHKGSLPQTTVEFADRITLKEGEGNITNYEYDQITHIHTMKHICVLKTGGYSGIILKKDSFTSESFEEFKPFIYEKCRRAKVVR